MAVIARDIARQKRKKLKESQDGPVQGPSPAPRVFPAKKIEAKARPARRSKPSSAVDKIISSKDDSAKGKRSSMASTVRSILDKSGIEEPFSPASEKELTKDKDISLKELAAEIIIGLAPALIGKAVSGDVAGAAGAKSGIKAVESIGKAREREAARNLDIFEAKQRRLGLLEQSEGKGFSEFVKAKREAAEKDRDREFKGKETDKKLKAQKDLLIKRLGALENKKTAKGKTEKEPKPTQFQAAAFAKRLEQSEEAFEDIKKSGFDASGVAAAAQRSGAFPEALRSEESKLQDQAERNFVNALLRRESGAAISPAEFESAEAQYFPRIGDTPKVLQQKRVNRQIVFKALKAEAGGAFDKIGSLEETKHEVATQPSFNPKTSSAIDRYAKKHGITVERANAILEKRRAQSGK
jgi:hypothetical protein